MTVGYMRSDLALEQIDSLRREVRLLREIIRLANPNIDGRWLTFDSGSIEAGFDANGAVMRALEER